MTDTVFALASGAGRAGVAVLRLSGPRAGDALCRLTGRPLPPPRMARVARLAATDGEAIDQGLVLWFPAPHSFTGEDVAELQVHGGRAVIAAVTEALLAAGVRPAEPGEFSRRAFLNGKMDLTAAEGLADLVDAETAAQRRQALRQMDGALVGLYEGWRARLVRAQAHFEAAIDFADEDLPPGLEMAVRATLGELAASMQEHLADNGRGERLRDGVEVTIIGAPNVGKSSLLNRLARREAAIVSATAGTTRDVVEVHLELGGYPVILADTAGLRAATEEIEGEGIRRARQRAARADLKLAVFDATAPLDAETLDLLDGDTVVVLNKADMGTGPEEIGGRPPVAVSALTGAGLDDLLAILTEAVAARFAGGGTVLTRARHRVAVEEAVSAIERALAAPLPELAAEDLRLASRAIGRITGRVDVEELLDVIFRDFCIGK